MRSTALRLGAFALASLLIVSTAPPRSVGAAGEPILIGATVSESGPGATLGRPGSRQHPDGRRRDQQSRRRQRPPAAGDDPRRRVQRDDRRQQHAQAARPARRRDHRLVADADVARDDPARDRRQGPDDLARVELAGDPAGRRPAVDLQDADHRLPRRASHARVHAQEEADEGFGDLPRRRLRQDRAVALQRRGQAVRLRGHRRRSDQRARQRRDDAAHARQGGQPGKRSSLGRRCRRPASSSRRTKSWG